MELQKVPAAADGCVFSSLRAGSLYRLQAVSWSRDMSSDSSTLARTGQSTYRPLVEPLKNSVSDEGAGTFLWLRPLWWSHDPRIQTCFHLGNVVLLFLISAVCSDVSGGRQFGTDGQTDGQLAPWRRQLERLSGEHGVGTERRDGMVFPLRM